MAKFIPYEKLSKKKKREHDAAKRTIWKLSPVTRKPKNPKAYDRKKAQKWEEDPDSVPFALRRAKKTVQIPMMQPSPRGSVPPTRT